MSIRSNRRDDETLLAALRMRCDGASVAQIAKSLGYARPEAVRIATNGVRAADLEESGEPSARVLAAYPWPSEGGRRAKE